MKTSQGKVSYLIVTFGLSFMNSANLAWLASLNAGAWWPQKRISIFSLDAGACVAAGAPPPQAVSRIDRITNKLDSQENLLFILLSFFVCRKTEQQTDFLTGTSSQIQLNDSCQMIWLIRIQSLC